MGRPRKYLTEEDKKTANKEKQARWYSRNKEKVSEYKRKFYRRKKRTLRLSANRSKKR